MAINASIPLSVQPAVQIQDPLTQYAKLAQVQSLIGQNQLSALQRRGLTNQLNEHDRVLAAFRNLQPGQSVESVLPEVYQASPTTGIAISKNLLQQKEAQTNIDKNNMAIMAAKAKDARDTLSGVTDQASYDQWRQYGSSKGYQVALNAPPQYDPNWQKQHIMTADSFLTNLNAQAGRDVTMRGQDLRSKDAAAGRDVTIRGQNMTDKRQRELNGILANGEVSGDTTSMAQAIANYQLAPLSGFALRSPKGQRIMGLVMKLNPDYNAQDYVASQKAYSAFTSGKQGDTVRSFSVAMSHLDTLSHLTDALGNGSTKLLNKWANAWKSQTGQPAPTNFDAAKQIVGDEIIKAVVGAGGGEGDRQAAQAVIDKANSPQALKDAIHTYKELMAGQLGGLRRQYEQSTKRKDFNKFLSKEAIDQLEPTSSVPAGPAAAGQSVGKTGETAVRIKGDDGYNALRSGALFIGPDGVTRRKP